jgi:hypothetical protein
MKKYFERMRGHEKFTTSLEISSGPPPPALIMNAPLATLLAEPILLREFVKGGSAEFATVL